MAEKIMFEGVNGEILHASTANPLPVTTGTGSGSFSGLASTNVSSGTVTATNGAGGTQVVIARATRDYTEFTNTGSVTGYFGTGTVDSTFQSIAPGETKAWNGQQALKVLSSGANIDIKFTDYYN